MRWVILREFDDGTQKITLEMNPDFVKSKLLASVNSKLAAQEKWNKRSFSKDEVTAAIGMAWDELASEFKAKTVNIRS